MKSHLKLTFIVTILNVETVLRQTLESIVKQVYPIEEILLIDNHSTDSSLSIARKFKNEHPHLMIRIIARDKTYGLPASYNLGAAMGRGDYIVTLHSDSRLPSKYELSRLIKPFTREANVVCTAPHMLLPRSVWVRFNFWQKCLFARDVGKVIPSGNGKFECYEKKAYSAIGGYDERRFGHTIGSEDADMHYRLRRVGKVILTKAQVVHMHGFDKNYTLKHWIARRKFLAITYGRHLQIHSRELKGQALIFFIKSAIAFSAVLVFIHPIFLVPLLVFPFFYMSTMFKDPSTNTDIRIIVLPIVLIFLMYYETYWMLYSLLFMRAKDYN